MVDYPGAGYWRQLAEYYPNAKVLHSERDPDKWFDSTQATIFEPGSMAMRAEGPMAAFFKSVIGPLRDNLHDRATMTDHFRRHNEEVKRTIRPERLLVYEAGQGWEPLCRFLDVPVPSAPYPAENTSAEFILPASTGPLRAVRPALVVGNSGLFFPVITSRHLGDNQLIPFVPTVAAFLANCGMCGVRFPGLCRVIAAPVTDGNSDTVGAADAVYPAISIGFFCRFAHLGSSLGIALFICGGAF